MTQRRRLESGPPVFLSEAGRTASIVATESEQYTRVASVLLTVQRFEPEVFSDLNVSTHK